MKAALVFFLTFFAGAVIGLPLAFVQSAKKSSDARKGWNLRPIVVAAVDISAGTTLTMEMISQRSIPEQFFEDGVVTPDEASYVINRKVSMPLQAGDPLTWPFVNGQGYAQALRDCVKALSPAVEAAPAGQRDAVAAEAAKQWKPEVPEKGD